MFLRLPSKSGFFSAAAETLCLLVRLLYRVVCYYMEFETTRVNPVAWHQTVACGKSPIEPWSPHPNSPHTNASIPKAFHCFLKSQYNNVPFLKVLVLLIYSLNKRRKKYQSLHKTVNRKPEASVSALFLADAGNGSINHRYSGRAGFYVS